MSTTVNDVDVFDEYFTEGVQNFELHELDEAAFCFRHALSLHIPDIQRNADAYQLVSCVFCLLRFEDDDYSMNAQLTRVLVQQACMTDDKELHRFAIESMECTVEELLQGDEAQRIKACKVAGEICSYHLEIHKGIGSTIAAFLRLKQIAEQCQLRHVVCYACSNIGHLYHGKADALKQMNMLSNNQQVGRINAAHEDALKFYEQALEYATTDEEKASVICQIGDCLQASGKYAEAIQHYEEGVRYAMQKNNYEWARRSSYMIGICYFQCGQIQHAQDALWRSLGLANQCQNSFGQFRCNLVLAVIEKLLKHTDRAYEMMVRCVNFFSAQKDHSLEEYESYIAFGMLEQEREENDIAAYFFTKALFVASTIRHEDKAHGAMKKLREMQKKGLLSVVDRTVKLDSCLDPYPLDLQLDNKLKLKNCYSKSSMSLDKLSSNNEWTRWHASNTLASNCSISVLDATRSDDFFDLVQNGKMFRMENQDAALPNIHEDSKAERLAIETPKKRRSIARNVVDMIRNPMRRLSIGRPNDSTDLNDQSFNSTTRRHSIDISDLRKANKTKGRR